MSDSNLSATMRVVDTPTGRVLSCETTGALACAAPAPRQPDIELTIIFLAAAFCALLVAGIAGVVAYDRRRLRLAHDPYAEPFGDQPFSGRIRGR